MGNEEPMKKRVTPSRRLVALAASLGLVGAALAVSGPGAAAPAPEQVPRGREFRVLVFTKSTEGQHPATKKAGQRDQGTGEGTPVHRPSHRRC